MSKASPRERYQAALDNGDIQPDPAQAVAIDALQSIYEKLLHNRPGLSFLKRKHPRWPAVTGLYMWGGVGRGKTWLMDQFYEALPFSRKRRTHFHRFMAQLHEAIKSRQQTQDPLRAIATEIARQSRVLCFDEFFVNDIADAMLLGRLFDTLFSEGVTLIATSNVPPDGLYENGLQRQRFLAAIDALKTHCRILQVDHDLDYRLRLLEKAEIYHYPLDESSERHMREYFESIAAENICQAHHSINILGRKIACYAVAKGALWTEYDALCTGPRSAHDYVEIAREFHTVLLSRVRVFTPEHENEARRFVNLVDEFYDRKVKLIISAETSPERIYQGSRISFEFQRTVSRLQEMQSHQYLAQPHGHE